jgi:hypothetical protein
MISDKTFKKFQEVVKQEYGKDLTDTEAREILTGMTKYFDLLAKIHHRSVVRKEKDENEKKSVEDNNPDKK